MKIELNLVFSIHNLLF